MAIDSPTAASLQQSINTSPPPERKKVAEPESDESSIEAKPKAEKADETQTDEPRSANSGASNPDESGNTVNLAV